MSGAGRAAEALDASGAVAPRADGARLLRRGAEACDDPIALGAAFDEAVKAAGRVVDRAAEEGGARSLLIAGLRVRIRSVGPALEPLLDAAFGPLERPGPAAAAARADLTVLVIDGAACERAPGRIRAALESLGSTRRVRLTRPGAASAIVAGFEVASGALEVLDEARGTAVHWLDDARRIPSWAAAAPIRTLLGWWLPSRGRLLVHAAAIGHARGGILLAAKGGSGKSTCSLACLDATGRTDDSPLGIAGDDFVVIEPDRDPPLAHALLGTAKLDRGHAARFPRLAPLVVADGGPLDDPREKAVLRLFPAARDRLLPVVPLRAIVVPSLGLDRAESRVEPISRGRALLALAPSSIFLVRGAGTETLAPLRSLAERLPCFGLRVGSDPARIPEAITGLLSSLEPRAREEAPRG